MRRTGSRRRTTAVARVSVLLSIALAGGVLFASVPDVSRASPPPDSVAERDLESGKEALSRKDYEDAIIFFQRAMGAIDGPVEAVYWKGQAHEKLGQTRAAIRAYSEFLSLHTARKDRGESSRAEDSLAKKATKAVDKLGEAGRALDELNAEFVARLLEFARKHSDEQPAAARDACERIVQIDRANDEAKELLKSLGGTLPDGDLGKPAAGPFERLPKGPWNDLIESKAFSTDGFTYSDGVLKTDRTSAAMVRTDDKTRLGERFVLEADFRVTHEYEPSWLVGFVMGWGDADFYAAFAQRGGVLIHRGHAKKGPQEDLDQHASPPLDLRKWHRLGVRVEGRAMVVWFDGDLVCRTEVPDEGGLSGEFRLWMQRSIVEFRLLRWANLE